VKALIDAEPNMRALLTRDGDYFLPLAVRVEKARKVKADLFVSIHADAFIRPHARGSSVFPSSPTLRQLLALTSVQPIALPRKATVANPEFDRLADKGALLEWAVYAGHRYGTRRQWVDEKLEEGRVVLLDIDVQGAEQIRRQRPDALLVFLVAPSDEELQRRLARRGTESEAERARRLATARAEMAAAERFDHVVVNDDLERCVAQIGGLIRACVDARAP
jgi:guanylate kinase